MNKKVKAALIGLGVVAGIGLAQAGFVTAATETTTNDNFPPGIQKVVEKFNLNKDEVQKVLDEDRTARQAEMKQKFEENLTAAVTAGKITEEQKAAIIAKHNEIVAKRTEQRGQMRTLTSEFRTWLTEQGIDESIIHPEGPGNGRGMGGGQRHRNNL